MRRKRTIGNGNIVVLSITYLGSKMAKPTTSRRNYDAGNNILDYAYGNITYLYIEYYTNPVYFT